MKILPNNIEVEKWINEVVKHSNHVEYYLHELNLGSKDPERPHDLVGKYNKFDWEVLNGMALTYREGVDFEKYILPSIEKHRNQYHHQMWNNYNTRATEEDLFVGVIDTVCSMLERRVYSGEDEKLGRKKSWSVIEDVLYNKSSEYKIAPAKILLPEIRKITRPKLNLIKDIYDFPNIGIDKKIYDKIKERIDSVTTDLEKKGYKMFSKAL